MERKGRQKQQRLLLRSLSSGSARSRSGPRRRAKERGTTPALLLPRSASSLSLACCSRGDDKTPSSASPRPPPRTPGTSAGVRSPAGSKPSSLSEGRARPLLLLLLMLLLPSLLFRRRRRRRRRRSRRLLRLPLSSPHPPLPSPPSRGSGARSPTRCPTTPCWPWGSRRGRSTSWRRTKVAVFSFRFFFFDRKRSAKRRNKKKNCLSLSHLSLSLLSLLPHLTQRSPGSRPTSPR